MARPGNGKSYTQLSEGWKTTIQFLGPKTKTVSCAKCGKPVKTMEDRLHDPMLCDGCLSWYSQFGQMVVGLIKSAIGK
jgi:hypothetical protein